MKKLFHLTQSGIDELKAELDALKIKRIDTAEAIKTARVRSKSVMIAV
jgi:hypothetical protein